MSARSFSVAVVAVAVGFSCGAVTNALQPAASPKPPAEQPVVVRTLPDVNLQRDLFDYFQFGVTTVLLLAAIYQLKLVHRTLKATEASVRAAESSAKTEKNSLYLSLRARVGLKRV